MPLNFRSSTQGSGRSGGPPLTLFADARVTSQTSSGSTHTRPSLFVADFTYDTALDEEEEEYTLEEWAAICEADERREREAQERYEDAIAPGWLCSEVSAGIDVVSDRASVIASYQLRARHEVLLRRQSSRLTVRQRNRDNKDSRASTGLFMSVMEDERHSALASAGNYQILDAPGQTEPRSIRDGSTSHDVEQDAEAEETARTSASGAPNRQQDRAARGAEDRGRGDRSDNTRAG
ncbi:hypothetical protein EHS25_007829 [Saitozyma podzolica]|uniref:Uncharacterized protein n=1 Tax=Saitozyma podzolica TaxID=1890683 RepID=A0A427YQU6_9TREE|nr:hypothetical protein EHS25_007829 [Saitozyma podzolica]